MTSISITTKLIHRLAQSGSGHLDAGVTAYNPGDVRGILASRKHSPQTLRVCVRDTAPGCGLQLLLFALRNKAALDPDIYLHFIVVLDKSQQVTSQATRCES